MVVSAPPQTTYLKINRRRLSNIEMDSSAVVGSLLTITGRRRLVLPETSDRYCNKVRIKAGVVQSVQITPTYSQPFE